MRRGGWLCVRVCVLRVRGGIASCIQPLKVPSVQNILLPDMFTACWPVLHVFGTAQRVGSYLSDFGTPPPSRAHADDAVAY